MNDKIERNLGKQPIEKIMAEHNLSSPELVKNSTEQLTHKMVSRAIKGRRLTSKVQAKILKALNKAAGKNYLIADLFNY